MHPYITLTDGTQLPTYSAAVLVALVAMALYVWPRARKLGASASDVWGLFALGISTVFLGSRLVWFLCYDRGALLEGPGVLLGEEAGLCFLGGLAALAPALPAYLRAVGLPVAPLLAVLAPALCFGHAIGRAGCLLAGCCYGTPSSLAWAFAQPHLSGDLAPRHPAQIYEALILVAGGLWLHRKLLQGAPPRRVLGSYLLLLSSERFVMEQVRGDTQTESVLLGLSYAQSICFVLCALGLALLAGRSRERREVPSLRRRPRRARAAAARRACSGFSFVEVAIGLVILSLGLLPIFSMMAAGTRQSAFTSYHLFATMRAQRLLESSLTSSHRYFDGQPEARFELSAEQLEGGDGPAFPEEYRAKLDREGYSEEAYAERLDDGLYLLTVTIQWTFPAERADLAGRTHELTMRRMYARPHLSFTEDIPLETVPQA